jgi:Ca2+-binding EF-hand superfamily protein
MYKAKSRKQAYERAQDIKARIEKYDLSKTGTLSREEVIKMAADILNEYTPLVGGLTDEDVEMIMRCGGDNVRPELTKDEVPNALACMAQIRQDNHLLVNLFSEFDVDKTGELPSDQLTNLLTRINGGTAPDVSDVDYILAQCEPRGKTDPIKIVQLKAAVACWFCIKDKSIADKVKETFDAADTKGNGRIERDELHALLKSLNPSFSLADLQTLVDSTFAEFDTNRSNALEFDQFVDWIMCSDAK